MYRIRFFLSILIISIVVACNNNDNVDMKRLETYLTPDCHSPNMNNADIVFLDTIYITLPVVTYDDYCNFDVFNDSILYCSSMIESSKLFRFNMSSKKLDNILQLDPNLTLTKDIHMYKVVSDDSIYITKYPSPGIILINNGGTIINKWDGIDIEISQLQEKNLHDEGFGLSDCSRLQNLNIDGEIIYLVLSPASPIDFLGDPQIKRHGIYNLKERKWINFIAPYEGVLKYKGIGGYYYDMQHPYQLVSDKILYVTYPVDHRVYAYNVEDGVLLWEKDISPSVASKFSFPVKEYDDYGKLNELRHNSGYYGPLYYHSELGLYSRFYNIVPDTERRKRAIIVYDKNFNIVCEKIYEIDDIAQIAPTKNGFIFHTYKLAKEDTATFICANIKIKYN